MAAIDLTNLLQAAVKTESQNKRVVLTTPKGQLTFMNKIDKFDLSEIDSSLSGTHPAFIINGVEVSSIYVGTYIGVIKNGELVSQPSQRPSRNNFDDFITAAKANGPGHHLMTNAEWAAISLRAYKNGIAPLGNTYYGRSAEDSKQVGQRIDGLTPGYNVNDPNPDYSGNPATLTGTGPAKWRSNGTYTGITDLAGNVMEWCGGARVFMGELQVIANNDAAMLSADQGANSSAWKAINATTGELVTPNGTGTTPGTIKFVNNTTSDYSISNVNKTFAGMTNPSTTAPVSAVALNKLKALGLYPVAADIAGYANDLFDLGGNALSNVCPINRGGSYQTATTSGIHAVAFSNLRTGLGGHIGARPAYYVA